MPDSPTEPAADFTAPRPIDPLRIGAYSVCSAAGSGRSSTLAALRARRGGLSPNDVGDTPVPTWIGRVPDLDSTPLPDPLALWDCRNNRLAWKALNLDGFADAVAAARVRFGPERVALVLGTSTASIADTEQAYRQLDADGRFPEALRRRQIHTPHATGAFVQAALGLAGPCVTVATACSSSAKVFAQAERMIRCGLADAAVVGGVDTLCGSVLFGFNSLELVSAEPCRPFDVRRRGINLGEAAGFALLQRDGEGPALLGYGESSDAHHMSSPHPQGEGARRAVLAALARGTVDARDVDYVNLHGTASQKNDEIEARVIDALFPERTLASSTKGWTGHTLGAAGILEAIITLLALDSGTAPGTLNTATLDPVCGPQIRIDNASADLRLGMSLSFGFGGSNCALLFARGDLH